MTDHKATLYKAALLHDIGKFWQRSESKVARLKALGDVTLPNQRHWWLSFGFMRKFFGKDEERRKLEFIISTHHIDILDLAQRVWEKGLEEGNANLSFVSQLEKIKGKIRKPDKIKQIEFIAEDFDRWLEEVKSVEALQKDFNSYFPLASLVCEADTLASKEREFLWNFKPLPLESIFEQISVKKEPNKHQYFQPIGRLKHDKYKAPKLMQEALEAMAAEYEEQWSEFRKEYPIETQLHNDTLLYLLKKYLWCVPSAYCKSIPDISLYEHSKLTAAIALALYDFICAPENENTDKPENWKYSDVREYRKESAYLLLCGDVTGIQKYIYNIAHAGAMKALKGRSFWLQQIVDSIAFAILDASGLPHANLLFSTGGKFCLLLPNTEFVKTDVLAKMKPELEKAILKDFDGNLSLVFGEMELSGEDMVKEKGKPKPLNEKWADLLRDTDKAKTKKYASQIALKQTDFFQPGNLFGELVTCQATKKEICPASDLPTKSPGTLKHFKPFHHEHVLANDVYAYEELDEDEKVPDLNNRKYISEEQYRSRWVGSEIRRQVTAIYTADKPEWSVLGLEEIDFVLAKDETAPNVLGRILKVNDDNHLGQVNDDKIIQGWRFYGGDWIPSKKNKHGDDLPREFEEIIKDSFGHPRLGVLRMDVDNLGQIFHQGLENPPFSRIVQLCTMVDFFFSCYLNKLKTCWWCVEDGVVEAEQEAESKTGKIHLEQVLQIVYAGGDDIFIVGVWNVLPDVARWIHRKFTEFTCKNPCLTLSAGIALFENKFPLYKAAKYAADALDEAKSWKMPGEEKATKNSISFLGVPMRWGDFEIVNDWAKQWAGWLADKKVPKGYLTALSAIHADYHQQCKLVEELKKKEGDDWHKNHPNLPVDPHWGRWRWQGAYFLNRFAQRVRDEHEEVKKEILCFCPKLFTNQFEHINDCGETIKIEQNCIDLLPVAVRWADYLTREKSEEQ